MQPIKNNVYVFVTKNQKFRAKYRIPVNEFMPHKFVQREVTIGGVEWNRGKGHSVLGVIKRKTENIIINLICNYLLNFRSLDCCSFQLSNSSKSITISTTDGTPFAKKEV